MTRKIEAWQNEVQEGPENGTMDQALCCPLRSEGRVTAGVESKVGLWGGKRDCSRVPPWLGCLLSAPIMDASSLLAQCFGSWGATRMSQACRMEFYGRDVG